MRGFPKPVCVCVRPKSQLPLREIGKRNCPPGGPRAGEPARRAARRLAERERTAPQAKPPAGRGFMGQRPKLQQTKLYTRAGAAELVILEYGNMMRCLIDTECRKVCEIQHTHKQCTARKVAKRNVDSGCEREEGEGAPPPG